MAAFKHETPADEGGGPEKRRRGIRPFFLVGTPPPFPQNKSMKRSFRSNWGVGRFAGTALLAALTFSNLGGGQGTPKKPRFTAGGPEQGFGNAEGIGGGDAVDGALTVARDELGRSFRILTEDPERAVELCSVERCPVSFSEKACELVRGLNEAQRGECRAFGLEIAAKFKGALPAFRVTSDDLRVKEGNVERPVAAQTAVGEKGEVCFHRDRTAAMGREELNALIAHELGHKVAGPNGFVGDGPTAGAFATGRAKLDAVGASVAVFVVNHREPVQAPPELGKAQLAAFCSAKGDFLPGVGADVMGAPVSGDTPSTDTERFQKAMEIVKGKEARAQFVARTIGKYFGRAPSADETQMLQISMANGGSQSAILASVLSDPEYLNSRRIESTEDFVGHVYQEVMGRAPFALEVGRGVALLKMERKPAFVVRLLETEPTAIARQVSAWYHAYLNRDPRADETKVHVDRLRAGIPWESVQADLLATPEYYALQRIRKRQCK